MSKAVQQSTAVIEETLQKAGAYRKIDDNLYVIKQGSAYVMITVAAWGDERALVRFTAQVVSGVRMTGELALDLLKRNASMRFGAFAFLGEGEVIVLTHTLLGGATLDGVELLAAARDLALTADSVDDEIMVAHGGRRMQDLIEDASLRKIAAELQASDEEG